MGMASAGHVYESEVHGCDRVQLSVVIPCYNEEDGIEKLYERVTAVCRQEFGDDYEFLLVNDGSRDATWQKILALTDQDPRVVGVNLSRNHGHQLALSAGLEVCSGQRILIMDADLQDPPELLPDMLHAMDAGADVVYGQRTQRHGETAFKRITASLFYRLLESLVDIKIPVDTGDFRLMSRRSLEVFKAMPEKHRFVRGMVSWIGFKQVPLPYERQERFAGDTKYPLSKMIRFAIDAITSFSVTPLRLASFMGCFCSLCGFIALFYTLISWMQGRTVPGWTSVMTVIIFLGSAQLLVNGILGEYLGRLYIETKQRPLFIIDRVVRSELSAQTVHESDWVSHGSLTQ
jgi:polyisoprenyl-phosphate glycosyltransferase